MSHERHLDVEVTPTMLEPSNVPNGVYQSASAMLRKCIRKALADPVLRADYEQWKREQKEGHTA